MKLAKSSIRRGVTMLEHPELPTSAEIRALEQRPMGRRSELVERRFNDGMLEQIARRERSEHIGLAISDGMRELGALAARVFTALTEKLRHAEPPARDRTWRERRTENCSPTTVEGASMKKTISLMSLAIAGAALMSLAGAPAVAAEPERLFLAYGCGATLCSNEIEVVPATAFARGQTLGRTIKTSRYVSKASIEFKVLDGKRVAVVSWATKPVSGKPTSHRWTYEFSKYGVSTSIWFDTGTDNAHDLLLVRGTALLADLPLPLAPIKGNSLAKFSRENPPERQQSAHIPSNSIDVDSLEYPPQRRQSARYVGLR